MDEGSMNREEMIDSDDSSDLLSKSFRLPIPLEAAVQSNLEIAHRVLAVQLGLRYDGIRKFMDRATRAEQGSNGARSQTQAD